MRLRVRLATLIAAALTGAFGPAVTAASAADENQAAGEPAAADAAVPATAGTAAATQSSDNGPVEGPSHVQGSGDQPTGGPQQDAGASADASIGNDATVGQASGQGQDGGNGAGSGQGGSAAQDNPAAERDQNAHTGQQADANADASANGPKNDSKGVRNGQEDAGDGGPVGQANASNAAAQAAASQSTTQEAGPGSGSSEATGEQAASAEADAKTDEPRNSIVNTRVEAPGNDARFEQENRAEARAEAQAQKAEERAAKAEERAEQRRGEDVAQEARAAANAELEQPTNTAVELRLFSDGDTAGGAQSSSALAEAVVAADGPEAEATATAEITDPTNTFVSLRVNSAGTTDAVEQGTLEQEIETVNGASMTRTELDADDRTWASTDPESGLELVLTADGANTDLRIVLDDPSLARPSEGTVFIWTWDLVFGPGGELACAIASSAVGGVVTWNFDCDPADEIDRTGAGTPTPSEGAISWTWSWLRPDLPSWVWDYADVIPIPTCGAGCAYVFDFRWLSHEPVELATVAQAAAEPVSEPEATPTWAVEQLNEASATAVATTSSDAIQIVSQTTDETGAAPVQIVLQELNVMQVANARAFAELSGSANFSVDTGGTAAQANRATAEVEARVAATVVQQIAQHGGGERSLQTQAALQSTSTTQVLVAVGVATLVGGVNSGLSLGGTSTQATNSLASAAGAESSAVRQTVEQEQAGDDAEQDQVAGQWGEVVQTFDLVAAAGLRDARNESSLRDESSSLSIDAEAESTGSSRSQITQLAVQLQHGDETALQQESLQQAIVEQTGVGLAAATAGTIRLLYVTPPPTAAFAAPAAADTAAAPAEQLSTAVTTARLVFVVGALAPARVPRVATGSPERSMPTSRPAARRAPAAQSAAPRQAAASSAYVKVSASPTGLTAGSAPSMAEDAEKATARSSGGPCVAPLAGAAAVTAGNGSGSAFVALPGYVLTPLPRLGRRVFEPAGRRPAAVVLLRARPG